MWLEAGTWLPINDPSLASTHLLGSYQFEIVGIGNVMHELAAIFALFYFFLFALLAFLIRFIFALVNDLLDFFLFFGRFFGVERLVIFFDQPPYLLSIDLQNLVGLHFRRFNMSLAVEILLHLAIHIGVVVLLLLVLNVLISDYSKQLLHLFLRELAVGSWCQFGDSCRRSRESRVRRLPTFRLLGVGLSL